MHFKKRQEKFSHVQLIVFYKIVFIDNDKKAENIQTFCIEIQNYYFDNHYQIYICNSNICDLLSLRNKVS